MIVSSSNDGNSNTCLATEGGTGSHFLHLIPEQDATHCSNSQCATAKSPAKESGISCTSHLCPSTKWPQTSNNSNSMQMHQSNDRNSHFSQYVDLSLRAGNHNKPATTTTIKAPINTSQPNKKTE